MRSSVYYGARAMARELNRQRSAHQRSMEAEARRIEREEMYEEGLEEEQEQNNLLIQKRDLYHEFADTFMVSDTFFSIDSLRKKYIKSEFKFKDEPKFINNAKEISVPKKSSFEKIFKFLEKRRINKLEEKKEQERKDKLDYEKRLEEFNKLKEITYNNYLKDEKERQEEIIIHNKNIDKFEEDYKRMDKNAEELFFKYLLEYYNDNYIHDPFEEINLCFEPKKLIVEVNVKDVNEFIGYSHCKYVKSRNRLEYFYYNETGVKNEFADLLPKFALGFANMFFKHDFNNSINTIIVNMIFKKTYLVSLKIDKDEFNSLNLNNIGDLNKVYKNNMSIFKTLHSVIKVYDYIK